MNYFLLLLTLFASFSAFAQPKVQSFTSTTVDGSYKSSDNVNITANINQDIKSGNTLTVTLDTGDTVLLTAAANGQTLVGTYTVGSGDTSSDLTVSSFTIGEVEAVVNDQAMTSTTVPSSVNNLGGSSAIVVDTTSPSISSSSTASVAENQTTAIDINATDTNTITYSISGGDSASFGGFDS